MNVLISSALTSDLPAVESSRWIRIGNFRKRENSTNAVARSPNACVAVFFGVFRKPENFFS